MNHNSTSPFHFLLLPLLSRLEAPALIFPLYFPSFTNSPFPIEAPALMSTLPPIATASIAIPPIATASIVIPPSVCEAVVITRGGIDTPPIARKRRLRMNAATPARVSNPPREDAAVADAMAAMVSLRNHSRREPVTKRARIESPPVIQTTSAPTPVVARSVATPPPRVPVEPPPVHPVVHTPDPTELRIMRTPDTADSSDYEFDSSSVDEESSDDSSSSDDGDEAPLPTAAPERAGDWDTGSDSEDTDSDSELGGGHAIAPETTSNVSEFEYDDEDDVVEATSDEEDSSADEESDEESVGL